LSGARSSSPVIGSNGRSFLVAWTQLGSPLGVVWTGSEWIVASLGGLVRISADGERARPMERPYSNARRLFIAPVAAPRCRAVSHP
jgi:hypothetical protein